MPKKFLIIILVPVTLLSISAYLFFTGFFDEKYTGVVETRSCVNSELGCEESTFSSGGKYYILEGSSDFTKYSGKKVEIRGVIEDGPPWGDIMVVKSIKELK